MGMKVPNEGRRQATTNRLGLAFAAQADVWHLTVGPASVLRIHKPLDFRRSPRGGYTDRPIETLQVGCRTSRATASLIRWLIMPIIVILLHLVAASGESILCLG